MNLHEYQAKELLKKYKVPVQEGFACGTVHEAEEAYRQIKTQYGSSFAVVKAQIHAGGRGKGVVKETGINGVKVGKNLDDVIEIAKKILGGTLVTVQEAIVANHMVIESAKRSRLCRLSPEPPPRTLRVPAPIR